MKDEEYLERALDDLEHVEFGLRTTLEAASRKDARAEPVVRHAANHIKDAREQVRSALALMSAEARRVRRRAPLVRAE